MSLAVDTSESRLDTGSQSSKHPGAKRRSSNSHSLQESATTQSTAKQGGHSSSNRSSVLFFDRHFNPLSATSFHEFV